MEKEESKDFIHESCLCALFDALENRRATKRNIYHKGRFVNGMYCKGEGHSQTCRRLLLGDPFAYLADAFFVCGNQPGQHDLHTKRQFLLEH